MHIRNGGFPWISIFIIPQMGAAYLRMAPKPMHLPLSIPLRADLS
jgi:hypothetical protein